MPCWLLQIRRVLRPASARQACQPNRQWKGSLESFYPAPIWPRFWAKHVCGFCMPFSQTGTSFQGFVWNPGDHRGVCQSILWIACPRNTEWRIPHTQPSCHNVINMFRNVVFHDGHWIQKLRPSVVQAPWRGAQASPQFFQGLLRGHLFGPGRCASRSTCGSCSETHQTQKLICCCKWMQMVHLL